MKTTSLSSFLLTLAAFSLCSCGGGGGGGDQPQEGPCSALKIAGGEGCSSPPGALTAVVRGVFNCTGTFITTRHVLTAAHCVYDPGAVSVISESFAASVQRVSIHPQYNPFGDSQYDVAVLTIGTVAPVSPVPIETSRPVEEGDQVVAYGYGLDQDGQLWFEREAEGGDGLKATYLDVTSVSDFSISTISDGSGDTCGGDSGGPLLRQASDGSYGIVALTRSGPSNCVPYQPSDSQNTNVQSSSILNFVLGAAPGTQVR